MNTEQARLWNGDAGHAWVETQQLVEQMSVSYTHLTLPTKA